MVIRIIFFGVLVIKIGLWITQSESSYDEWENDENTRRNFTKEKNSILFMKEKFKIIIMDCIILESDNLKRMDDSVLFQLPPELLCGLLSKLPGEDLKQFGNSFEFWSERLNYNS